MSNLKELFYIFRDWNRLWENYNQNSKLYLKPPSQERFLEEMNKRYEVIKKDIYE